MAIINNDLLVWAVEPHSYFDKSVKLINACDINTFSSLDFKSGKTKLKFIFSDGSSEYNDLHFGRTLIEGANCNHWLLPSEVKIKEFPFLITNNLSFCLVYHGEIKFKHSVEGYFSLNGISKLVPVWGKDWIGIMGVFDQGKICNGELWAFSVVKDFNKNNLNYYEPDDDFSHGEIISFS